MSNKCDVTSCNRKREWWSAIDGRFYCELHMTALERKCDGNLSLSDVRT